MFFLITGASGVGKSTVRKLIDRNSPGRSLLRIGHVPPYARMDASLASKPLSKSFSSRSNIKKPEHISSSAAIQYRPANFTPPQAPTNSIQFKSVSWTFLRKNKPSG